MPNMLAFVAAMGRGMCCVALLAGVHATAARLPLDGGQLSVDLPGAEGQVAAPQWDIVERGLRVRLQVQGASLQRLAIVSLGQHNGRSYLGFRIDGLDSHCRADLQAAPAPVLIGAQPTSFQLGNFRHQNEDGPCGGKARSAAHDYRGELKLAAQPDGSLLLDLSLSALEGRNDRPVTLTLAGLVVPNKRPPLAAAAAVAAASSADTDAEPETEGARGGDRLPSARPFGIDVLRLGMTLAQVDQAVAGTPLVQKQSASEERRYSLHDSDTGNEIRVALTFRDGRLRDVWFSVEGDEREPGAQHALWSRRIAALYGRPNSRVVGGGGSSTFCHGPGIGVSMPTSAPRKGASLSYRTVRYRDVSRCDNAGAAPAFDPVAYSQQPLQAGGAVITSAYDAGSGDKPHPKEAAAMAGDLEAQWQVGATYLRYTMFPAKQQQGVKLLEAASARGDARSMNKLGEFYARTATPRDPTLAVQWFAKAEAAGHPFAAYNIGGMHERGEGTPVDRAAAMRWYLKSADSGDPDGAAKVMELAPDHYQKVFDAIPAAVRRDAEDLKFTRGTNPRDYMDALLFFQAQDWIVNKYPVGTLRNVKVTSGDSNSGSFVARAHYGYRGATMVDPQNYYLDLTMVDGKINCIRYGDDDSQCWVIPKLFIQPGTTQSQREACFREKRTPYYTYEQKTICSREAANGMCTGYSTTESTTLNRTEVALSNQCTFPIEVEPANPGRSRRSQGRVLLKPNSSVNLLNTSEKRVP